VDSAVPEAVIVNLSGLSDSAGPGGVIDDDRATVLPVPKML